MKRDEKQQQRKIIISTSGVEHVIISFITLLNCFGKICVTGENFADK